jgi:uncharacterized protein (DUF362 family)
MDRRSFIKRSAATGAAAFLGTSLLGRKAFSAIAGEDADITVVSGTDYFGNTIRAVEALGGMQKFVPAGAKVGLLINSAFEQAGAYVHPDVSLAVVKMCFDASAAEVTCLQVVDGAYWERSALYADMKAYTDKLVQVPSNIFPAEFNEEDWELLPGIDGAKGLKEVEVIRALGEVDVLINVFIAKHHPSTLLTGAMKNSMGFCTRKTNVFYHLGSGERNDPEFLAQCIADINMLRQPDLIIGDATEFIVTNGPAGPGDMLKLDKVFAGTNLIGMDALAATFNNFEPEEILTNLKGQEAGLGSYELENYNIVEVA